MSAPDFQRLDAALSAPSKARINYDPFSARQLIYKCWASLLYENIPDRRVVGLLHDGYDHWHPSIYLTQEDREEAEVPLDFGPVAHDQYLLDSLDASEIAAYIESLEARRFNCDSNDGYRMRSDISAGNEALHPPPIRRSPAKIWLDKEFDRLTKWILWLRIVEGSTREKHWPPLHVKTQDQLISHSTKNPKIGWLNIGSDLFELRRYALGALAKYFFENLKKKIEETHPSQYSASFLETWAEVFAGGTFRLGITHICAMGFYNGKECYNVVYDFDPSNSQFHCFPALDFPQIRADFHEGQLDL